MSDGQWIETCGCGRETHLHNAAFVVTVPDGAKPCDAAHPHDPDERPWVVMELGGCACGEPERVDDMMLAYLASREPEGWPKPAPVGVSEDAALLLAYLADMLGWTEHGGSVGGAWLTEDGAAALANLREP